MCLTPYECGRFPPGASVNPERRQGIHTTAWARSTNLIPLSATVPDRETDADASKDITEAASTALRLVVSPPGPIPSEVEADTLISLPAVACVVAANPDVAVKLNSAVSDADEDAVSRVDAEA
jgi:hypothetical protein